MCNKVPNSKLEMKTRDTAQLREKKKKEIPESLLQDMKCDHIEIQPGKEQKER